MKRKRAPSVERGRITIRSQLKPGDIGSVVRLHGVVYAKERGFDRTFEAYVAVPLAEFALAASPRERIWLAERNGRLAGCVAVVSHSSRVAQLRWFLVAPAARRTGLGTTLLREALAFCEARRYREVILWTVSSLEAAARLYRSAGFERVATKPGRRWGVDVTEEKYRLVLAGPPVLRAKEADPA